LDDFDPLGPLTVNGCENSEVKSATEIGCDEIHHPQREEPLKKSDGQSSEIVLSYESSTTDDVNHVSVHEASSNVFGDFVVVESNVKDGEALTGSDFDEV